MRETDRQREPGGRKAGTVELKKLLCCTMSKAREDEEMIRGMESFSAVVIVTIRTAAAAAAAAAPQARRHLCWTDASRDQTLSRGRRLGSVKSLAESCGLESEAQTRVAF